MKIYSVDDSKCIVSKINGHTYRRTKDKAKGKFAEHLKEHGMTFEDHDQLDYPGIEIIYYDSKISILAKNDSHDYIIIRSWDIPFGFPTFKELSNFFIERDSIIYMSPIKQSLTDDYYFIIDCSDNILIKRLDYYFILNRNYKTEILKWLRQQKIVYITNNWLYTKEFFLSVNTYHDNFYDYKKYNIKFGHELFSILIPDENDAALFALAFGSYIHEHIS